MENVEQAVENLESNMDMELVIAEQSHTVYKLSKPVKWMKTTYTELDLNFESLTGKDFEAIDDELQGLGIVVPTPAINHRYQRMLAARAANVPNDMLTALSARDYNKVTTAARNFLFATA